MTAVLAMAALLLGAVLGMRFKVLALAPAIFACSLVILGVGIAHDNGFWAILLGIVAVLAALQMGYLAGSVIRFVIDAARRSKELATGAMQRPIS